MNATIVSSFPAMHSFRSPRGFALAFIVLLHVAFFFALSSGLGMQLIKLPGPDIIVVDTPPDQRVTRSVPRIPIPVDDTTRLDREMPRVPPIDLGERPRIDIPPGGPTIGGPTDIGPQQVLCDLAVVPPNEDATHPLSAPAYPAAEIR